MDDAVFEAQSYLRNIGRLDSDISNVVPDGIFAAETTEAVKSFQKKYGLEEAKKKLNSQINKTYDILMQNNMESKVFEEIINSMKEKIFGV